MSTDDVKFGCAETSLMERGIQTETMTSRLTFGGNLRKVSHIFAAFVEFCVSLPRQDATMWCRFHFVERKIKFGVREAESWRRDYIVVIVTPTENRHEPRNLSVWSICNVNVVTQSLVTDLFGDLKIISWKLPFLKSFSIRSRQSPSPRNTRHVIKRFHCHGPRPSPKLLHESVISKQSNRL